jgi:hypothetical protein
VVNVADYASINENPKFAMKMATTKENQDIEEK